MQVRQAGKELGFDIRVVTEQERGVNKKADGSKIEAGFSSRAKRWLTDSKFIVLNNFSSFDSLQQQELLVTLFELGHPYVRYEHDYGFCRRRTSLNCDGNLNTCP